MWLYIAAALAALFAYLIHLYKEHKATLYWPWDDGQPDFPDGPGRHRFNTDITVVNPDTGFAEDNLHFPRKDFLWGVASAAHQVEGDNTNNQWHDWENDSDKYGE